MGTSRHKPKRCETCIFYKSSDLKGQGWCTHPKRQQSGGMLLLVRAGALDCRNSWGEDFWTPADDGRAADAQAAPPPFDPASPISAAQAEPAPSVEDFVVRQDTIMHHTVSSPPDDDESINHAALSDQEERAQVMARGAREAIQRARQRKKEQLALSRQPAVAPLPSADTEAGEWSSAAGSTSEDVVLSTRHQSVDPFKRSYGAPQPPVPSRELPTDTGGIVSRYLDDRFDSVPEIRDEVELPRPAHFQASASQASVGDDLDTDAAELPQDSDLTSYDLVLQRARRFQRRTGSRPARRTITPPQRAALEQHAETAHDTPAMLATPADLPGVAAPAAEPAWEPEPVTTDPTIATGEVAVEWADDDLDAPAADEFVMPDWDDDLDVSWIMTPARPKPAPKPERRRLRLPQLNLRRHRVQQPQAIASSAFAEDDVIEETAWTAAPSPQPFTHEDADPDWVDEIVPVETYAASQPDPAPADMSAEAYVETVWEDEWDDDRATETSVSGYAISARDLAPASEAHAPVDEWDENDRFTPLPDDRVTGEATVRHRPQPALAPFDLAKLRSRLFAHDHEQGGRAAVDAGRAAPRVDRTDMMRRQAANVVTHLAPDPDDDPDPDPGSGVETALPALEQHWREPEAEFDLRAVVRRQDELLDMRIQLAPDVPRTCHTCRSFRAAEGGERGWCTNEWAFSHRRMVNTDDLPCESSIGCWWLPADNVCLPADDLAKLTGPTPLVDRLLGRLPLPGFEDADEEEPRRARAR